MEEENSLDKDLFLACLRGDVDGVKYYLEKGANMNFICPFGRTPFGAAAQMGNVEILQVFLNHCKCEKPKPRNCSESKTLAANYSKQETQTAECYLNDNKEQQNSSADLNRNKSLGAIENNDELLLKKLSVDQKILCAFKKTNHDLVTFNDVFVRKDPRSKSKNGLGELDCTSEEEMVTPDGMDKLEWDVEIEGNRENSLKCEDHVSALYLWYTSVLLKTNSLVEEKPSNSDINREDQFGLRALHYATVEGHAEAVKLLINAGCKVNVGDSDNLTPLHMAAAKDSTEVMQILLEAGASVHQKTTDRISPLHVSASRGLLENVKLLVSAGAHIDTLDSSDRSPLFMAVSRSHQDVVAYLLEHGAKVNLEEIHGYTPLYEAVWQKNTTIVKMLLSAGAKITQSHHLLHYAVLHRHEEMVRLLISAGSIINLRDENGDTPLLVAAKTLQSDISRLLLTNGASINCSSYITGKYPLHEVVCNLAGNFHKFHDMFNVLQEFNVNLEAETEAGCTALCLAISRKFDDAAATLVKHGANVNHSHSLHANLFRHLLLRENHFLIELFLYSGYRLQDIPLPKQPTTLLEKWVAEMKINPLKLCDLCRIKIRSQYKSRVQEEISKLLLPPSIKTFLLLGDIT